MKSTLMLGLSLMFILGSIQAQDLQFPAKIRKEGNPAYTYEALEAQRKRAEGPRTVVNLTDAEYENRVKQLSNEIPMRFNEMVESHIKAYVTRRRSNTEQIIARGMVYFPIFEESFRRYNVPTELKYLAVVESTLNPRVVSPAGAAGLWQFMKPTGKTYGLKIDAQVDERRDSYASSDAAARYLMDLYKRYNDWNMAIAAYNCGPGRIDASIKQSGKIDYWKLSHLLPKETQNFVPAFIGVAYAMTHYEQHNIYPEHPEYDLQLLDKIRVFDKITFRQISDITGITEEAIRFMNPSFNQNYVPESKTGHILSLPLTVMASLRAAVPNTEPVIFGSTSPVTYEEPKVSASPTVVNVAPATTFKYEESNKIIYRVKKGDNLGKIAEQQGCSVKDLRAWNGIEGSMLQVGQKLVIVKQGKYLDFESEAPETPEPVSTPTPAPAPVKKEEIKTQAVKQHQVKRGETLWGIAAAQKVSIKDILNANGLNANSKIEPGTLLIIPNK